MAKAKKKETPLMRQYNSIKEKYPNALLLFRVGDFYETFGSDAEKCAEVLDIVLTKRANGSASHIALAGFPHHALNTYLPKLVKAGLRVAICDQLEDPKQTKTIVKRGVTELVTPGVAMRDNVLTSKDNNFLMAIYGEHNLFGIAFLDVSTGEFFLAQTAKEEVQNFIDKFRPSECLYLRHNLPEDLRNIGSPYPIDDWAFKKDFGAQKLQDYFKVKNIKGFGLQDWDLAVAACGALFHYLEHAQYHNLGHVMNPQKLESLDYVWLDEFTLRNLEVFHSPHPEAKTLLQTIDYTKTPMGARLLRNWLGFLLVDQHKIIQRQESVKFFYKIEDLRYNIREELKLVNDVERLTARLAARRITPKQLVNLADSLLLINDVKKLVERQDSDNQTLWLPSAQNCVETADKIQKILNPEAPHFIQKGNVIREEVSLELDKLRALQSSGLGFLEDLKAREEENTGIPKLKVSFNNVFGYYIEVRNTHKDKVPEHWVRKQTLVSAERYITEELKEYEQQIVGAEERIAVLEKELYEELVEDLQSDLKEVQKSSSYIACIDVLTALAELAIRHNYTRPEIVDDNLLYIEEGRHPVIEQNLPPQEPYISNSVNIVPKEQQILMITGPNMSGKSALLRQTALIAILAQMGSYVPAKYCKMSILDKIFTRVGASDNISLGESTFMVEMNETASILNNLSERSLILLDEIGRGTSTYDGVSIAWSITEFLHEHPYKPKTLFATHYHELNDMTKQFSRIQNYNVSIKELKDKIIFLRKLAKGGSEHSFGIHVAKLAGMPQTVVLKASQILRKLENNKSQDSLHEKIEKDEMQLSFFQLDDPILEAIRAELLHTDVNTLTPIEALMKLNEIKKKLGQAK